MRVFETQNFMIDAGGGRSTQKDNAHGRWAEGQRTGQGPTNVVQVPFPSFAHVQFPSSEYDQVTGACLAEGEIFTFDSSQTTMHMLKNEDPEKAQILPKATQQKWQAMMN